MSPACSRCIAAGTPCVALDASTNRAAPRSIAQFLETEIANREQRYAGARPDTSGTIGTDVDQTRSSPPSTTSLSDLVTLDFTPNFLGITAAVPFARCVMVGTRIPSTRLFGATDIDEDHPRSIINPLPSGTPLRSIPIEASKYLFDNYMTRVAAQYPIFYASDVSSYFDSIFRRSSGKEFGAEASPYEVYVISMIMAISLTTAARTQHTRASSIASGLFKHAVRQVPTVLTNDLRGLQALLLLLQYSFLDPGAANIWLLSGFSSQACIDLGLHQELPASSALTVLARDMRRRIFWCAYEMEVAVCAALLRPTILLRRHVEVAFPTEIEDGAISDRGIDPIGRPTKFTSHRIWRFRQIESEIVSILFQNEDFPGDGPPLDAWMARMEKDINDWDAEVHHSAASNSDPSMNSQWAEMDLYAHIATPYIIVTLFRPCPRIREPNCENLMKAFVAAVKVADGYFRQANLAFGNSKYVFHPCHQSFSSAVVFLQALQRCKENICIAYTVAEVEEFMATFSRLFTTMTERWPAATRCLEAYERLSAPVKKDYLDFIAQRARTQSVSYQVSEVGILDGFQSELTGTALDLDEIFNLGSLFGPPGTSSVEDFDWMYYSVPTNWNAEFDFEIS